MRLFHEDLLGELPRQLLLDLHRTCCNLRGRGWDNKSTRNNPLVGYVMKCPPVTLFKYHSQVMVEMDRRGYRVTDKWLDPNYRGQFAQPWAVYELYGHGQFRSWSRYFPEHNDARLKDDRFWLEKWKQMQEFLTPKK